MGQCFSKKDEPENFEDFASVNSDSEESEEDIRSNFLKALPWLVVNEAVLQTLVRYRNLLS